MVIDQYNVDQKPGSQHTRYSFKPVFFTALETKNKLYETSELDHSTVMGGILLFPGEYWLSHNNRNTKSLDQSWH